jgi:hypothetical protein
MVFHVLREPKKKGTVEPCVFQVYSTATKEMVRCGGKGVSRVSKGALCLEHTKAALMAQNTWETKDTSGVSISTKRFMEIVTEKAKGESSPTT